ncbi:MAG: hypothetical protein LBI96_02570 [Odoribacteraceae bacterium]|jgi:hypothetical protein|nr:hypothetical protein [Odoribacteraceae bacterium]
MKTITRIFAPTSNGHDGKRKEYRLTLARYRLKRLKRLPNNIGENPNNIGENLKYTGKLPNNIGENLKYTGKLPNNIGENLKYTGKLLNNIIENLKYTGKLLNNIIENLNNIIESLKYTGKLLNNIIGIPCYPTGGRNAKKASLLLGLSGGSSGNPMETMSVTVRKWYGGIRGKYDNVINLNTRLKDKEKEWNVPPEIMELFGEHVDELDRLVMKCRTMDGSPADRMTRNNLLNRLVKASLNVARNWAYGQYALGKLLTSDIHLLGFMVVGERSTRHPRSKETLEVPEVSARALDSGSAYIVLSQGAYENAARVASAWPRGVRNAVIVIMEIDGREIIRHMTTRVHNVVKMPEGCRGKQFIVKASFLKHVDDNTHFGNETVFTMPLTVEDIRPESKK